MICDRKITGKKFTADDSPEDLVADEDVTNQTFSVANSTCDSTFVVGEPVAEAVEVSGVSLFQMCRRD